MRADRIVVVAEVGSHQELVASGGRYAQMYATWTGHVGNGRPAKAQAL